MSKQKFADECVVCALESFCADLQAWLSVGGDERLLEFTPLDAWAKVLKHLSEMQTHGETQHFH